MTQVLAEKVALPLAISLAEFDSEDVKFNADLEIEKFATFYDPESQVTEWSEDETSLHPLMTIGGGLRSLCYDFRNKAFIYDDGTD